ncbi:MAG TPA: sodium:calcium antiporter, partial [Blastocatellia bacterium]|nr:sodium:calcium antiporter [Blastocatellia bacterium]
MWLNGILFAACLGLVLWASELLARGVDRLGSNLHLSDELIGILTALGADSPEISSAIVALISNKRDLGVGIVLGSNLFNLAAL